VINKAEEFYKYCILKSAKYFGLQFLLSFRDIDFWYRHAVLNELVLSEHIDSRG